MEKLSSSAIYTSVERDKVLRSSGKGKSMTERPLKNSVEFLITRRNISSIAEAKTKDGGNFQCEAFKKVSVLNASKRSRPSSNLV